MMKLAADQSRKVYITMMYLTPAWEQVWANLQATCVAEAIKAKWFKVIHITLSTNEGLQAIRLVGLPLCANCGVHNTFMHKNIEYGEGRKSWEWTRNHFAWILRMDPVWIHNEWTIRPQFKLWPPQHHRAVLWILAHMVWCKTRGGWTL